MICFCGNPVEDDGALCPRCAALRVLELGADATEKEIKAAYRLLVKVWHPDRFQDDPALKEAAEAKLKAVNSAFVLLSSPSSSGGGAPKKRHAAQEATPESPFSPRGAAPEPPGGGETAPYAAPVRGPSRWIFPALKTLFKFVVLAFAILLCRYLWIAFDVPTPTSDEANNVLASSKMNALKALAAPRARFMEAIERDLRSLDPRKPPPESLPQAAEIEPGAEVEPVERPPAQAARPPQPRIPAKPRKIYSFITVGSTKEEVLAQQGPPTAQSDEKLVYGRSELYFKDNSVVGWRIDPVSSPIRVKLWPESAVDTSLDCFTVGSSKDLVLVVQGTPTAFSADKFEYGGSEVYFQNNRVVRWKSDPTSIPLRARP